MQNQEGRSWVNHVAESALLAIYVARASLYGPEDWEHKKPSYLETILSKLVSKPNYAEAISLYQKAFMKTDGGISQPIIIGNLNSWFIGATIKIIGSEISIHNPHDWFDYDGYSVIQELGQALTRGMNGCGIISQQKPDAVSINPQTRSINYALDCLESAEDFAKFLYELQQILEKENKTRLHKQSGLKK